MNEKIKNKANTSLFGQCVLVCLFLCFSFLGYAQSTPKVSSEIDTTFIKIGEQVIWTVTVATDSTSHVTFPEGQTFSPLETVEAYKTDTIRNNDGIIYKKIYALTQFDSGSYKLPIQRIDINGKGFFTDSSRVNVATVPVDTLAQKMFDIKPLMVVEKSNSKLWLIILAVVAFLAILGGLLYWFVFREKKLTEEEKIALLPPYDRALLELQQLETSRYLIQDEYKKYYSELTDIVRSYLEEDVNVSALESTTDQLIDKLEMMTDAGELELDKDTIFQFKRILQTADLVKFAKSKPDTSVAEQDRQAIKDIVVKTHDALPEPTEEELMEQAEYQEELERKKKRKKWYLASGITAGAIICAIIGVTLYIGPKTTWDTVSRNPTKILLESDWVSSSYGFPPITLETPGVLVRQETELTPELKAAIKELHVFAYKNEDNTLTTSAISTVYTKPEETDFKKTIETFIKGFEKQGIKNIVTKQEEFTTASGVKGLKVYGTGKFPIEATKEILKGKYAILLFGGEGFSQQVVVTWLDDDGYAEEIANRIITTIEVKTEL